MPDLPVFHMSWVCSNSCPLSQWCHSTISSSVAPFSFCPHHSPHQSLFQWTLHIRWQKYWSFSFSISPSNGNLGLISFRIKWFDLLVVQGTPKTLLQHQSWKASILWQSAFFMIQHSHLYMTAGKTTALTIGTIVNKGMSLIFNMLSRLVIAFFPRSKHLLISWLQSQSTMILEPKKIVSHCFHCFPIYLPWSYGTGCHDLSFLNVEF